MKTESVHELYRLSRAGLSVAVLALSAFSLSAFPIVTNVVETGGDNEATDTITAKWTGVTFSNGVSGEFLNPFTVPTFGEDVPAYVDRLHQWNGASTSLPLPSYLVRGEYIMSGNDNRDNSVYQLDIAVSEPVLVYMLVDNRLSDGNGADPPDFSAGNMSWLLENGWTPVMNGLNRNNDPSVPDEIGVDEGGDGVGPGVALNQWSSIYVKTVPAGTFSIYQADNSGRNMYGVVIKPLPGSVSNPPEILNLSPTNNTLFYNSTRGISFTATTVAPNRIDATNISVSLNGVAVSSSLIVGGTSVNRTVSYSGLKPETIYNARIIVSDQAGRATTNNFSFDTFNADSAVIVEAEDYNYDSGKSLDAPLPAGYANLTGTPEVDYYDNNVTALATQYRPNDYVGLAISMDGQRQKFASAGATDYQVTQFLAGDWMNYTRNFFNLLTYNVYLRVAATAPQQVRLDKITGGPATANQVPFALGRFAVPSTAGAAAFAYVPLTDANGNSVALDLSGKTTLRLTAIPSRSQTLQPNFLMLVPTTAAARTPYVSWISPGANAADVALDAALKITIANGSTQVAPGSVALNFNGNDVTSAATISTTAEGAAISYDPPGLLATNAVCVASLSYSDTGGASFTNQWTFTTVMFKPIITSVVETDGDDSVNAPAQFTSQTFSHANLGTITLGAFQEEAPAYRNRLHQWNGASTTLPLPSYLVGGEYLMILQENRDNVPFQLDVTVSEPALVYLLVDNRLSDGSNANPPDFSAGNMSWLLENGWAPVLNGLNRTGNPNWPDEVGMDEGGDGVGPGVALNQWASVYVKIVPAGKFSLFQADNAGNNMYGVVIRAVSTHAFTPAVTITSPAADSAYSIGPTNVTITADASVANSSISKVEFFYQYGVFSPANKIGEVTSAPDRFVWSNVYPGRYALTAKATAANGQSAVSKPVGILVGKVISVNFQATTAEVPPGYLPDYGDIFADRGNGYNYGWDDDNTANARDRNNALSPDERYDTFNHWQKPLPAGRVWEIELPNGRYSVHAVVGEPSNQDSVYDLQVEGVTIAKGTPDAIIRFFEGTGTVTVTDGRLSLSNGPTAANNKVCFVDIAALPAEVPKPVFSQPVLSGNTLTISWTGGGRLQEATSVTGPWTDVAGNPQAPFTVQVTEPCKFFRVVVP
jgi:hypothetical protein